MKRITILFVLLGNLFVNAEKVAEFPWIEGIPSITVSRDYLYVGNTRDGKITVVARQNNQRVAVIGGKGQGPGEFIGNFGTITAGSENIFVESGGKMGIYTLQGRLLEEKRLPMNSGHYVPAGRCIVFRRSERSATFDKAIIALMDWQGNPVKELASRSTSVSKPGEAVQLSPCFGHAVAGGKIVVLDAHSNQLTVHFYNLDGKLLRSIQPSFEKRRVDDGYKTMVQVEMEERFKKYLHRVIKWKLVFPEYYPICESFSFDGTYLYLFTFYTDGKTREVWVMDQSGNVIRKKRVPYMGPYSIFEGSCYCFLENDQTENMELHAFPLLK